MAEIPLESYPIPMRCLAVVERRIQREMGVGKLLEGLNYDREGRISIQGGDTLPLIQFVQFIYEEQIYVGSAPKKEEHSRGNTPLMAECTLEMLVGARREYGLFRRDDADDNDTGLMEWVGRIQDSIEMDDDGNADAFLGETLIKPVKFKLAENYVSELTFALLLNVEMTTVGYHRSERSPCP